MGNPHWPPGVVNDIDEHMQDVEAFEKKHDKETLTSGPFTVFRNLRDIHRSSVPGPASPDVETSDVPVTEDVEAAETGEDQRIETCNEDDGDKSHTEDDNLQTPASDRSSNEPRSLELRSKLRKHGPTQRRPSIPQLKPRPDSLVSRLMDHYVHNLATVLQPVLHSKNAYSAIYATEAMAVAKSMPWSESVQQRGVSDSKVALLYSLLTSASFHLRGFDRTDEADSMARYFRIKAVSHLRLALDSIRISDNRLTVASRAQAQSMVEAVFSVMLTLITADVSLECS